MIVAGNLIMIAIVATSFLGAIEPIGSSSWNQLSIAYITLTICLVVLYFISTMIELLARREQIFKQLKSIYNRYICCGKLDQDVMLNKYDENSHRERVTNFQTNLLYQKEIKREDNN